MAFRLNLFTQSRSSLLISLIHPPSTPYPNPNPNLPYPPSTPYPNPNPNLPYPPSTP